MKLGLGAGAAGTAAEAGLEASGAATVRLRDSLLLVSSRVTWAAEVSLKGAAALSEPRPAAGVRLACCALLPQADAKMIAIPKIGFFILIFLRLS